MTTGKAERFEARLSGAQKEILQRAAELTGRTLTDFVLNAAQAAAEEAIRNHHMLDLTSRETESFLAALANPPHLESKLEDAIRDSAEVRVKW